MASHAAVSIDDDFSSGKPAIALRPTDDEASGRIDMKDRVLIQIFRRNDCFNDAIDNRLSQFAVFDVGAVLCRDDDVFYFYRLAVAIFDGDLGFAVRSEEISFATFAHFGEVVNQAVRHLDGKWHQLWRLVTGIAEHHALIAGALLFVQAFAFSDALRNIGRLLLDRRKDRASVAVESHGGIGIADVANHFSHDIDVAHFDLTGDFAGNDNHAGLGETFTGNAAVRIARQMRIENRIGYLVTELVRVTFRNRFGRK